MSITTTPVEQNGTPPAGTTSLPAIFGEQPWRKSAPAKLRGSELFVPDSKSWAAWRELQQDRTRAIALWKREDRSPLCWGMEQIASSDNTSSDSPPAEWKLVEQLYAYVYGKAIGSKAAAKRNQAKSNKKAAKGEKSNTRGFEADQVARAWLAESDGATLNLELAAETLAWTYALPQLAADLTSKMWWQLLARVVETVRDAQQQDPQASPAVYQMLAAEAALVLGVIADELRICKEQAQSGGTALMIAFDQLLDGEGTPHRDYLRSLRPLAASWLRCSRLLAENDSLGTKQVRKSFRQFDDVRLAIARFARVDRSSHFGVTLVQPKSASKAKLKSRQAKLAPHDQWLKHLVAAADDDDVGVALQEALGINSRAADADQADGHFECAGNAEWSELAVLRSSWRRYSPRMTVDYGQPTMRMEISAGQHLLFDGAVGCELSIDGKSLPMSSSWTCVCWQSDSDCDYLELESHPTPGVLLQRSIMLAHEDCFAWVADSISTGRAGELDYRLSLPAAAGLDCKFSAEHTEAELTAKKSSLARVLPLALPEWRSSARDGKMSFEDGNLVLQQRQQGWGLYAGVFIDLETSRLQRPFTWRQLTVAENREILSRDLAVAQRVQIGDNHWVFYRSVGAIGNRTFLGINVATELLAARFETDGEYETLVEVQ